MRYTLYTLTLMPVPREAWNEGLTELLAACIGGAIIVFLSACALTALASAIAYLYKRRYLGWFLIFLFSPLFVIIGAAAIFWTGQFCERWPGFPRFARERSRRVRIYFASGSAVKVRDTLNP